MANNVVCFGVVNVFTSISNVFTRPSGPVAPTINCVGYYRVHSMYILHRYRVYIYILVKCHVNAVNGLPLP